MTFLSLALLSMGDALGGTRFSDTIYQIHLKLCVLPAVRWGSRTLVPPRTLVPGTLVPLGSIKNVELYTHFYRTHVHMGSDHWVAMSLQTFLT